MGDNANCQVLYVSHAREGERKREGRKFNALRQMDETHNSMFFFSYETPTMQRSKLRLSMEDRYLERVDVSEG